MKYIFGLGNPGKQYDGTRHNMGFAVIDTIVAKWLNTDTCLLTGAEKKKNYESWEFRYFGATCAEPERVFFIKPLTFMNRSGDVVGDWIRYAPSDFVVQNDLWIVHDELDVPLGCIKIGVGSSSAGHNGVQSIIDALGVNTFVRFRVGIQPHQELKEPLADFVLKSFMPIERETVERSLICTTEAIEIALSKGISRAQMQCHTKEKASGPSLSAL